MSNDENVASEEITPIFTGKLYDFIKKLVQVIIPGFSAMYFAFANIWGLPGAEQVVGSLAAINLFLGLLIGVSSRQYKALNLPYDGSIVVTPKQDGGTLFTLELNSDPNDLPLKKSVVFDIVVPTQNE
mgnify:CR=1 FL=1